MAPASLSALENAQREDRVWRDQRRGRVRRLQGRVSRVYDFATDSLARLGLAAALFFLVGVAILGVEILLVATHRRSEVGLGGGLMASAVAAIAVLIFLGFTCWLARSACDRLIGGWAARQEIDLAPGDDNPDSVSG